LISTESQLIFVMFISSVCAVACRHRGDLWYILSFRV